MSPDTLFTTPDRPLTYSNSYIHQHQYNFKWSPELNTSWTSTYYQRNWLGITYHCHRGLIWHVFIDLGRIYVFVTDSQPLSISPCHRSRLRLLQYVRGDWWAYFIFLQLKHIVFCVLDGVVFTLFNSWLPFFLSWRNNPSCVLISAPFIIIWFTVLVIYS